LLATSVLAPSAHGRAWQYRRDVHKLLCSRSLCSRLLAADFEPQTRAFSCWSMYMRWGLALFESPSFFLEQLVSEAASRFAFFAVLWWYLVMHCIPTNLFTPYGNHYTFPTMTEKKKQKHIDKALLIYSRTKVVHLLARACKAPPVRDKEDTHANHN
jgi:hypothetical protein